MKGNTTKHSGRWVIALTGASGQRYGLRVLEVAAQFLEEVHVVCSEAALRVMRDEERIKISKSNVSPQTLLGKELSNVTFHDSRDIGSEIASGSALFEGMVIIPCSMNTLAAVASGISGNLIQRCADVVLKERRKLVVVPRETPLSEIHLENMLRLSRLGAVVLPAMPGFYQHPKSVDDLVDGLAMKVLDQMGIDSELAPRWSGSGSQVSATVVGLRQDG